MKLSASVGIGILSLLLGVPAAIYAQDEPKQDEPKPEKRQDETKPPKPEKTKPESGRQDEMKAPKQDETKPPKQEEMRTPKQEGNPQEHPEQAQGSRPAGKSGHIPDDKFRAHFGRAHTVVINRPVIVEGQPRFQYGGFWFVISDPWPGDWAYSDQCYIDYIDGEYFLFDLLHPGVRIALIVVM